MAAKQNNLLQSKKSEKFCYAFGGVGSNLINGFVSSYLTMYFTDSVGLASAFAGTMMLVCRVFDGVSDLIMGVIIDKTRSRFGKARAWILWSTVPLILTFIALFCVPAGLSETGKMVWSVVMYFLVTVVFFTANNLAYHTLLLRFSLDSADRSGATAIRSILSMVTMMGMNVITPIALSAFGGATKQSTWTILVLVYAALTLISLAITFFGTKEKVIDENKETKEKVSTIANLKILLKTKYFYITLFLFLAYYIVNGAQGVGVYYARDVLGNMSLQSVVSMISLVPTFVCAPLMPKLIRRFGKKRTIMTGLVFSCLGCLIILIAGQNVVGYMLGYFIRSAGGVPMAVAIFTLNGDIADYLDMKYGTRPEALVTASNNIGQKLGTGLGAAILGWMLAWGNYVGGAAVQSESAKSAIVITAAGIPLAIYVFVLILFLFWDIEKFAPDVKAYMEKKISNLKNKENNTGV